MAKTCCGSSVGVLIEDQEGRLLMIERGWWPLGAAPVAGHVYDAHHDAAQAAVAETEEEVGLTVTGVPTLLWEGRLPNRCASLPADPPGHYWWLYHAQAAGELRPAPGEARGAGWYTPEQVDQMAQATVDHAAAGRSTDTLPADALEAVWVEHLVQVGWISAARDLEAVARLYTTPPPAFWRGGRPTA